MKAPSVKQDGCVGMYNIVVSVNSTMRTVSFEPAWSSVLGVVDTGTTTDETGLVLKSSTWTTTQTSPADVMNGTASFASGPHTITSVISNSCGSATFSVPFTMPGKVATGSPIDGLVIQAAGPVERGPGTTLPGCSAPSDNQNPTTVTTLRPSASGWSRAGVGGTDGVKSSFGSLRTFVYAGAMLEIGGAVSIELPGKSYGFVALTSDSSDCGGLPSIGVASAGSVYAVDWNMFTCPVGSCSKVTKFASGTGCVAINNTGGKMTATFEVDPCDLSALRQLPTASLIRPPVATTNAIMRVLQSGAFCRHGGCKLIGTFFPARIGLSKSNSAYARANVSDAKHVVWSVLLRRTGTTWKIVTYGSDRTACGHAPSNVLNDLALNC